jgi:hypothetical protein
LVLLSILLLNLGHKTNRKIFSVKVQLFEYKEASPKSNLPQYLEKSQGTGEFELRHSDGVQSCHLVVRCGVLLVKMATAVQKETVFIAAICYPYSQLLYNLSVNVYKKKFCPQARIIKTFVDRISQNTRSPAGKCLGSTPCITSALRRLELTWQL